MKKAIVKDNVASTTSLMSEGDGNSNRSFHGRDSEYDVLQEMVFLG